MPILIDELLVEAETPAPAPAKPGAGAPHASGRSTPGQADRMLARAILLDRHRRLEAD